VKEGEERYHNDLIAEREGRNPLEEKIQERWQGIDQELALECMGEEGFLRISPDRQAHFERRYMDHYDGTSTHAIIRNDIDALIAEVKKLSQEF
jgi:hypothetical protein|tara:strand:+ start:637 stop:918 length:282 start_codon:yes stop_codon:yes gene_type:complete